MSPKKNFSSKSAFTLVEIMVAVVILGMLAALALPTFAKLTSNARSTSMSNDLRAFRNACETYMLENFFWPPDTSPGVFDAQMSGYISQLRFEKATPFGGSWDTDTSSVTFGIGFANPDSPDSEIASLDALIDDGNLSTGFFRKFGSSYYYVLEE